MLAASAHFTVLFSLCQSDYTHGSAGSPPLSMTCLRMRSHRKRLAPGSMPVEGSSMSTTARAAHQGKLPRYSLRLLPPAV